MTRRIPARSRPGRVRTGEEGYALMFVVAMAAIVAIMLYVQIPSVAFEAQRDREQLLIDRGEQYSRAIQLFVHKFNRFPTSMEELENTNNIRFLRRRYNDPMTGKQDWRILHAGPGGVILDSVTSAKKTSGNPQQTFITEMNMTGSDVPEAGNVNLATRVRPSDQPGGAGVRRFPRCRGLRVPGIPIRGTITAGCPPVITAR